MKLAMMVMTLLYSVILIVLLLLEVSTLEGTGLHQMEPELLDYTLIWDSGEIGVPW